MRVKTPAEIAAALNFAVHENEKLNSGLPKHNMHAAGHCLPSCNLCSVSKALRWVLGEPNPTTGRPEEFPYVTQDEREHLLALADLRVKSKLSQGAKVNDW